MQSHIRGLKSMNNVFTNLLIHYLRRSNRKLSYFCGNIRYISVKYAFPYLWTYFGWFLVVNLLQQSLQYGFFLVWVLSCIFPLWDWENLWSQCWQEYGCHQNFICDIKVLI